MGSRQHLLPYKKQPPDSIDKSSNFILFSFKNVISRAKITLTVLVSLSVILVHGVASIKLDVKIICPYRPHQNHTCQTSLSKQWKWQKHNSCGLSCPLLGWWGAPSTSLSPQFFKIYRLLLFFELAANCFLQLPIVCRTHNTSSKCHTPVPFRLGAVSTSAADTEAERYWPPLLQYFL